MRGRDLPAVRERGFERGSRLPVDDGDFVPVPGEVPRGRDADDARAENDDAHVQPATTGARISTGALSAYADNGMQLQKRLRSP